MPSTLISQGLLFSDGHQFWHATLDDQWHLVCTPLDDSFGAQQQEQSPNGANSNSSNGEHTTATDHLARVGMARNAVASQQPVRLLECEFCAFGELEEVHERILRTIPSKLRGS